MAVEVKETNLNEMNVRNQEVELATDTAVQHMPSIEKGNLNVDDGAITPKKYPVGD
jgi:hypothetical protein